MKFSYYQIYITYLVIGGTVNKNVRMKNNVALILNTFIFLSVPHRYIMKLLQSRIFSILFNDFRQFPFLKNYNNLEASLIKKFGTVFQSQLKLLFNIFITNNTFFFLFQQIIFSREQ